MIPVRIIPTIPPQMSIVLFIIACRERNHSDAGSQDCISTHAVNKLISCPSCSVFQTFVNCNSHVHACFKQIFRYQCFLLNSNKKSINPSCLYVFSYCINLTTTGIPSIISFSSGSRSASTIPTISNSLNTFCSTRLNMESISSLVETRSIFIFE